MIKSQMLQKWENVYIYYNETNSISLGNVIPLFLYAPGSLTVATS